MNDKEFQPLEASQHSALVTLQAKMRCNHVAIYKSNGELLFFFFILSHLTCKLINTVQSTFFFRFNCSNWEFNCKVKIMIANVPSAGRGAERGGGRGANT